jgi:hypothetical protein
VLRTVALLLHNVAIVRMVGRARGLTGNIGHSDPLRTYCTDRIRGVGFRAWSRTCWLSVRFLSLLFAAGIPAPFRTPRRDSTRRPVSNASKGEAASLIRGTCNKNRRPPRFNCEVRAREQLKAKFTPIREITPITSTKKNEHCYQCYRCYEGRRRGLIALHRLLTTACLRQQW